MATFWLTYGTVDNRARSGGTQPVLHGRSLLGAAALSTSGSSQTIQRAAVDFSMPDHGMITVRSDGAVWVHIAAAPTAAAGVAFYLAAAERMEFSVEPGDKIAVINA